MSRNKAKARAPRLRFKVLKEISNPHRPKGAPDLRLQWGRYISANAAGEEWGCRFVWRLTNRARRGDTHIASIEEIRAMVSAMRANRSNQKTKTGDEDIASERRAEP